MRKFTVVIEKFRREARLSAAERRQRNVQEQVKRFRAGARRGR